MLTNYVDKYHTQPVQLEAGELSSLIIIKPKKKFLQILKFLSLSDTEFYADYFVMLYIFLAKTFVSKKAHLNRF